MSTKGYFAHNSPENKTPWFWFDQVGYKYVYAGENLAINFNDSKDVAQAWMNSPTHRDNILKAGYTEVGTALSTGMYKGKEAIFVVQLYASPKIVESAPVSITTSTSTIKNSIVANIINAKPEIKTVVPDQKVLGESTTSLTQTKPTSPTFFEKLISSPHQTTNAILLAIFALVALAIILSVSIKINIQHPDLITNGLILLIIILAIYLTNNYFSIKNASIDSGSNIYFLSTTTPQNN